ncbi:MAG: hypothetical protein HY360_13850 [Verrucomicrobia bacterium]|nr:hypothetical protein [Verrucomicrobiota bacterium]
MTTKAIPQLQWTEDAELERYAAAKHDQTFDDLGELSACFAEVLRRSRFDLSFLNKRFSDACSWRTEAVKELKRAMLLPSHPRPVKARVLDGHAGFDHQLPCWRMHRTFCHHSQDSHAHGSSPFNHAPK